MINILRATVASGDTYISVFSFKYPELKRPLPVISCMPTQPKIGQWLCAGSAVLSAGEHPWEEAGVPTWLWGCLGSL